MATIFSQIVEGKIPSFKVAEVQDFLAFLDINPVVPGHTLVIPKREIDLIYDLDDETYISMQLFAKTIAKAMQMAIGCKRIGFAVIGLEVPHAHIHLIPLNNMTDMDFNKPRVQMNKDQMTAMVESIQKYL